MKLFFCVAFIQVILLFSTLGCAMPVSKLPNELIYLEKPIDTLCLFETQDTQGRSNLRKCGINSKQGRHILGQNNSLKSMGFIGYNYSWATSGSMNTRGYSYYKEFGTVGHSIVLYTMNNSGGTGNFSSLSLLTRTGNTITISNLNGGDRCNGGVVDVRRVSKGTHQRLIYSVNLTAYDFLILANTNPHKLKPYEDLSACATCCVAKAVFQRSIGPHFMNEKLLYVDSSTSPQSSGLLPSEPKYQACFDQLLKDYGQKNHEKLDAKQLALFKHQFDAQCIHDKGPLFKSNHKHSSKWQ